MLKGNIDIKNEFKKINRKPLLYLTTNQLTKKREEELKKELKLENYIERDVENKDGEE